MPRETLRFFRDEQAACVCVAALFISLTGLSLITADHLKYTIIADRSALSWRLIFGFTVVDWVLLCGALSSASILLIWRPLRHGLVTCFETNSFWFLVPVVCGLLWDSHAVFGNGLLVTGDAGTHVARVNHLVMAIGDGKSLYRDNWFFGGSNLLQFTGPVFHWIAAALQLLTGDATPSIKIVVVLFRLAAAWFMAWLMRQLGVSAVIAWLTGLFHAGSFLVTYMAVIRCSFPQMVNFAVMPAILLFVERILAGAPRWDARAVAGLALAVTAFVGAHQPSALIFGILVILYIVLRLRKPA